MIELRNMKTKTKTLTPELLRRMDAYWRAANYLSDAASRVAVRVIRTDEERMIAKMVCRVLGLPGGKEMCHEDEED